MAVWRCNTFGLMMQLLRFYAASSPWKGQIQGLDVVVQPQDAVSPGAENRLSRGWNRNDCLGFRLQNCNFQTLKPLLLYFKNNAPILWIGNSHSENCKLICFFAHVIVPLTKMSKILTLDKKRIKFFVLYSLIRTFENEPRRYSRSEKKKKIGFSFCFSLT